MGNNATCSNCGKPIWRNSPRRRLATQAHMFVVVLPRQRLLAQGRLSRRGPAVSDYTEDGIDRHLDPMSYEAAVQYRAVREAEHIVLRAERGPERNIVTIMFEKLRETRDEEITP